MMRLLWPTGVIRTPTVLMRVGRVLHWLGALGAVLWLVAFGVALYDEMWNRYGDWEETLWLLGVSLAFYSVGRGLRYVFAAE